MADQPKKKNPNNLVRNAERRNGKAFKADSTSKKFIGRREYRGSHTRRARLTELDKALLGGGAMKRITKRLPGVSVDR